MTDRKIKIIRGAFGSKELPKIINRQAHIAHLSDAGRGRVEAALKAGVEAEAKKFGLRYGIGGKHIEALKKYPRSIKYPERRLLKTKEREALDRSLGVYFKVKPAEQKIEKKVVPLRKVEAKTPPRIAPRLPEPPPREQNDRWQEAA